MAGFRMHVGTSSALGVGYAGALHSMYGVPLPTATVAGTLCGVAGMLPDNACGRADLPACPEGEACYVNASDQATMHGVGICQP